MTAIPQPSPASLVTDRIVEPLRQVARRRWRVSAIRGAFQALIVALTLLLPVSLFFGFLPNLPVSLRVALAALAWGAVAAAAVYFLRPALRRRRLAQAAREVERRMDVQERLSSAVELADETDPRFAGSPELLAHLVRQAEQDAARVNAAALVPAKPVLQRWSAALAPVLIIWLTLGALWPRPVLRGLYLTFMPWKPAAPAMLSDVVVTPGDVTVPAGDPVAFTARVNTGDDSGDVARATLTARYASGQVREFVLNRTGPREFALTMEGVREAFEYRVRTDRGDSPSYRVSVLPRPAISSLDVHYDYPSYTGLAAVNHKGADGAVAGVVGTHATLTLHLSAPIDTTKSRLLMNEGRRDEWSEPLTLAPGTPSSYRAKVVIRNSGQYRVRLVNADGITNSDDHPRPITATDDHEPTVAVTSPRESDLKVRPDDTVPVRFEAGDDFGVSKVEAVVRVDDGPEQAFEVTAPQGSEDRRRVEGEYRLSVGEHLKRQGVAPDRAKTVTYFLRATDNRDPDPQARESGRHTLTIDRGINDIYAVRETRERQKDLQAAIREAIHRLNQAESPAHDLRHAGRDQDANEDWVRQARQRAEQATDLLAGASKDLAKAANEQLDTGFDAVAQEAKDIATNPIREAADLMGQTLLSIGRTEARSKSAEQAQKQIADARKRLERLMEGVDKAAAQAEANALIEDAAEKQEQLADAIEQSPPPNPDAPNNAELTPPERQAQQDLLNRVEQAVSRSEALRDGKAVQVAQRLAELTERVQRAREQQQDVGKQTDRLADALDARERVGEIADRQRELNQQIRDFALDDRPQIERAEAQPPDVGHQQQIVNELHGGNPNRAHELQRDSVNRLRQAAERLRRHAARDDLRPTEPRKAALEAARQNVERAEQAAREANQAGEQLREAVKDKDDARRRNDARAKAREAAEAVAKQADQAAAVAGQAAREAADHAREAEARAAAAERDAGAAPDEGARQAARAAAQSAQAAAKNAAEAKQAAEAAVQSTRRAKEAADEARQAVWQNDADEAAGQLKQAGDALREARKQYERAARENALADQAVAAADAAAEAAALAERQQALAELTKPAAEALAKATQDLPSPQDLGQRAREVQQQARQAAQAAEQLERLAAERDDPSVAERADAAHEALEEAAKAAEAAARAEGEVASKQEAARKAREKSAQAQMAANESAQKASDAGHQAAAARQRAAAAEQTANAEGARRSTEQASQLEGQSAQAARQGQQAGEQASAAAQQAQAASDAAQTNQAEAVKAQSEAGRALAEAMQALRGVRESVAAAGEAGQGDEGAQSGDPQSPQESMAQAARQVQEGLNAQRQAMQNMPQAARQAAHALEQAAESLAAAQSAQGSQANGQSPSQGQARAPSKGQGQGEGAAAGAQPGQTSESRQGVSLAGGASGEAPPPAAVEALGLSSGDWAKLPPQMQRDLLNAAQQSGPPAYREMIKNYYVRIARLRPDEAGAGK